MSELNIVDLSNKPKHMYLPFNDVNPLAQKKKLRHYKKKELTFIFDKKKYYSNCLGKCRLPK